MASHIRFYKPYLSDKESSSDDDSSDTSGYTSEESLLNLPGEKQPVETGQPEHYPFGKAISGLGTNMDKKNDNDLSKNTTLFMINSRDRDTRVYQQPTFFTLRLPRVFKNVKTISISQINLLNSFFNFSQANGNTFMYVYEQGRTNATRIQIPDGTYNSTDLVNALTSALNATPIFAAITLSSFINGFQNSGDYTPIFNTPGQYVYNSMTSTYDVNQTVNDIVARYFQTSQTLGQTRFSYNESLVAFYYPVIKELIIAQPLPVPFDTAGQSIPSGFTSWYDYIVFGFQGLNDPYITLIAQVTSNQTIFDNYRARNSFTNSLLNAYTCTYNAKQGRLVINTPSLNTSISTDLNTKYANILNSLVTSNGFANIADFSNQYNNISFSNAALIEFYNFIQSQFNSYFAVSYGSYSAEFYANSTNSLTLYDTLNRYGWNTTLNPLLPQYNSNAPVPQVSTLWTNITIPKTVATENTFISTLFVPEFIAGQLQFNGAGENTFGYTDISFALAPTTYIRTSFTTNCRQTISIMTLPRYINERSPETNESYIFGSSIGQTPLLFDTHAPPNQYILCDVSGNINWNMFNVEQNMFYSKEYMRNGTQWLQYMSPQILAGNLVQSNNPIYGNYPAVNDISINPYRPNIYFQMNASNYPVDPNAHYNVTFYVDTQSGNNFSAPINITWYKDRAAFMADIGQSLASNTIVANSHNYFKTQTYTDISSCTMVVDINNFQQTFFAVSVANGYTIPGSIGLRVFCVLTDTYGDFRQQTQLDQLGLPYAYLPPLLNQSSPTSLLYTNPTKTIYDPSTIVLGYDLSGISNNLLDYSIQAGNGNYYDPLSIQNSRTELIGATSNYKYSGLDYQFILKTNGSPQPAPTMSNWSLFFGSNSANMVQQNEAYDVNRGIYSLPYYTSSIHSTLTFRPIECTLTNWMDPNLPNVVEQFLSPNPIAWATISQANVFIPAINKPPLVSDMSTSATFRDASGVAGIGFFLPPGNIASLQNFTVKFAYTGPVYDQNIPSNTNLPQIGGLISRISKTYPQGYYDFPYNGTYYVNQTSLTSVATDPSGVLWDDWYTYNRNNVKLGIYPASQVNGVAANTLKLSNALCTLTLNKVTQVNNYKDVPGTILSREPEWGTWYEYTVMDVAKPIWTISPTSPSESYYPLQNPSQVKPVWNGILPVPATYPLPFFAIPPYGVQFTLPYTYSTIRLLPYPPYAPDLPPYTAYNTQTVYMTPNSSLTVPDAPILYYSESPYTLFYIPGDKKLTVYFTLNGDGGSDITNIHYSTDNGGSWWPSGFTSSPIIITVQSDGLTPLENGYGYSVLLKSQNVTGIGPPSDPCDPPRCVMSPNPLPPDPITILSYTPGNGTLTIHFTTGASSGSGPITDFLYSTDRAATWQTTIPVGNIITITLQSDGITPLVNGTAYNVYIVALNSFYPIVTSYYNTINTWYAVNNYGWGTSSPIRLNLSNLMSMTPNSIPSGIPDIPIIISATTIPGSSGVLVNFVIGSDGGSPITDILYNTDNDPTIFSSGSTTSPITLYGINFIDKIRIITTTTSYTSQNIFSAYAPIYTNTFPQPYIMSYRPGDGKLTVNLVNYTGSLLNPYTSIIYSSDNYSGLMTTKRTITTITNPIVLTQTTYPYSGSFTPIIISPPDIIPTYYDGFTSSIGYFKTLPKIFNYSYLPRSYGIAPSVGNAIDNPSTITTAEADIPNGYVAVPFYYDLNTTSWLPGSFFGLSYTRTPCLPSTNVTGASPYYGPPGPFAWSISTTGTFELYTADQPKYKPYYFNTKISFNMLDIAYNPATDLSMFGYEHGISSEYQDTNLFLYNNKTEKQDLSDVSTVVGTQSRWVWGQESNKKYSYFDDNSGYNFLSYLYNIPVSQLTLEYAVHVRAYDPIAKFNTGLRFIGKNFTDFGIATLADIVNDVTALGPYSPISDISGSYYNQMLVNSNDSSQYNSTISTNSRYLLGAFGSYSHRYADTVINFSKSFSTTQSFGTKLGYSGLVFTTTSYQDALKQYMNFYSTVTGQILLFTSILSTATGQLNIYILDKYGNILPPNALPPRSQSTAPIPFQLLFSTYTTTPYSLLSDQWGLGYNLGFSMKDTYPPRTTITSETFIRIVQDYVYLRLNPEFNMNKMGITNKENLSETRDPAAEDQKYFSKIILNDFASYCRTAIQRPVDFMPVLGQLNTISCQLVDRTGHQIVNADCEYDLVLEITELESKPIDGSTLQDSKADLNVIANTK